MIGAFLNLSRPLAMQVLSNPRILGSLLVGAVGSQQANEITNQLSLGNISLDDVYDTLINFAASPAVSFLQDKEKENQLTPQEEDDKKPKAPEPDPTDLLNLLKDDNNERDEKDLTTVRQGTEKEGSVIGTQEETSKAEQELLQGRLPSDQGTDVLRTEEGEKLASDALRNFFSKVLTKQTGEPKSLYKNILDISSIGQTSDIFDTKRIGNFENHIFTSIPTFKEAQIATADAVAKSLPENASILDIGGTEGGFVNTVAELRPDIEGIVLDPNPIAEKIFESQKLSNTDYIRQAFTTDSSKYGKYAFDIEDENEEGVPANYWNADDYEDNSLDAVIEKMTFQFIDRGRNNKVKLISEKLKPNGFALFEEKFFTSNDDPEWLANEAKKNEFKLQYYDQKDLTKKQKEVLEGMDELQVPSEDFEKILMKHFNNVAQYWDAGNFKGYIASDSADTINNFLGNMTNLDSEFSNVQTPRFITKPISEKRRGGPISIPKIDML